MKGHTSWTNSSSKRQRSIVNNNDDKKANSKIAYLFCLKKLKNKKTEDKCAEMLSSEFWMMGLWVIFILFFLYM